jgi:copper chaperone CopZ
MFNFLKKKQTTGTEVTLKINGMHCTSCALTIDDALEEVDGVIESKTNYAKSETHIVFDPTQVELSMLKEKVGELGYTV